MKIKLVLFLTTILFSVCSYGESMKVVEYPQLPNLYIQTPSDWVVYEKKIFGIEPKNRELDVSGTVYRTNGKTLEEFANEKHNGILTKMNWYKHTTDSRDILGMKYDGFIRDYEGVWPNENEPTTYIVTVFKIEDYFLSLTFTGLSKIVEKNNQTIREICSSVGFNK